MGSDIDPSCIRTARVNAGRAGVGSMITFETAEDVPWSLDGEYQESVPTANVVNEHNALKLRK